MNRLVWHTCVLFCKSDYFQVIYRNRWRWRNCPNWRLLTPNQVTQHTKVQTWVWKPVLLLNVFLCAGIYTAYKTFLHKDKILIKRLLKVSHHVKSPREPLDNTWTSLPNVALCLSLGFSEEETIRGSERHIEETSVRAHSELHYPPGEKPANQTAQTCLPVDHTCPI